MQPLPLIAAIAFCVQNDNMDSLQQHFGPDQVPWRRNPPSYNNLLGVDLSVLLTAVVTFSLFLTLEHEVFDKNLDLLVNCRLKYKQTLLLYVSSTEKFGWHCLPETNLDSSTILRNPNYTA